ncbi:MAG: NUDIX hydrolase [Dehalococcoidia bacterium]|nr:MAG: NUDIX hydrolase [Dehalococcoidia bacterium]
MGNSKLKQSGAMFLINRVGRVLLVRPAGDYNRRAPWMPPKEEIEVGEKPLEAALRATAEELGLSPDSYSNVRELGFITYKSKSKKVWCYSAQYLGKDDDISLDWENDRYGWFAIEEARSVVKEEFVPLLGHLENTAKT